MILVVKNADYSPVKIGDVVIPRDILEETLEVVNRYTSLSDKQVLALNDFIYGIINNNIKDKITQLCIPALAENVDEATMNCLNGEQAFMNVSSFAFESKELSLKVGDLATPQLYQNKGHDYLVSQTSNGVYVRQNKEPKKGECIFGTDSFAYFIRMQVAYDQFTVMTRDKGVSSYGGYNRDAENIFMGFNINNDINEFTIASGSFVKTVNYEASSDNVRANIVKFGNYNSSLAATDNWNPTKKTFGLVYSAFGLTTDEFLILKDLIEKLMYSLYE